MILQLVHGGKYIATARYRTLPNELDVAKYLPPPVSVTVSFSGNMLATAL